MLSTSATMSTAVSNASSAATGTMERLQFLEGMVGLNTHLFQNTIKNWRYGANIQFQPNLSTEVDMGDLLSKVEKALEAFIPEANPNFCNLATDWQPRISDPLVWRSVFHKISLNTITLFQHVSLGMVGRDSNKQQILLLGSQPDLCATTGIFGDQIDSDQRPKSLLRQLRSADESTKEGLEGMELLAYATCPMGISPHEQKLRPAEFLHGDIALDGESLAIPLQARHIKETAHAMLGEQFVEFINAQAPHNALYALLYGISHQYQGFSRFGCLRLMKRLIQEKGQSDEDSHRTLQSFCLKGDGDVFLMTVLMLQNAVPLRLAALDGRVRLMAATLANLGTHPASSVEELTRPRRLPPSADVAHLASWAPTFQLYWLDQEWDNSLEREIPSQEEGWTAPFKALVTKKARHRNLGTRASLRHLLAEAMFSKDTTMLGLQLHSALDQKDLRDQITDSRNKALGFILSKIEENVGANKIVDAFLNTPNTNQGQLTKEAFLAKVVTKDCWKSATGKYPRAPELNWFCVLLCDFARNGVARDTFRRLVMCPKGSPLISGDVGNLRKAWDAPLRLRDALANTLFELMASSRKSKFTNVLKHLLRLQVDSIQCWPLPFPNIPEEFNNLHKAVKGNDVCKLLTKMVELVFTERDLDLRLSDTLLSYLDSTSIDLSEAAPAFGFVGRTLGEAVDWLGSGTEEAANFLQRLDDSTKEDQTTSTAGAAAASNPASSTPTRNPKPSNANATNSPQGDDTDEEDDHLGVGEDGNGNRKTMEEEADAVEEHGNKGGGEDGGDNRNNRNNRNNKGGDNHNAADQKKLQELNEHCEKLEAELETKARLLAESEHALIQSRMELEKIESKTEETSKEAKETIKSYRQRLKLYQYHFGKLPLNSSITPSTNKENNTVTPRKRSLENQKDTGTTPANSSSSHKKSRRVSSPPLKEVELNL
jgi:hypothetical protein